MALLLFVQILLFQIALHCGLAAVIVARAKSTKVVSYLAYFAPDFAGHYLQQDPYASNWLERLRAIKRLKGKVVYRFMTGFMMVKYWDICR